MYAADVMVFEDNLKISDAILVMDSLFWIQKSLEIKLIIVFRKITSKLVTHFLSWMLIFFKKLWAWIHKWKAVLINFEVNFKIIHEQNYPTLPGKRHPGVAE